MKEKSRSTGSPIQQFSYICEIAERAARSYIFKRVSKKEVRNIDITIEVVSPKPLTLNVEVGLELSSSVKDIDVNSLVAGAVNEAIQAVDMALKEPRT